MNTMQQSLPSPVFRNWDNLPLYPTNVISLRFVLVQLFTVVHTWHSSQGNLMNRLYYCAFDVSPRGEFQIQVHTAQKNLVYYSGEAISNGNNIRQMKLNYGDPNVDVIIAIGSINAFSSDWDGSFPITHFQIVSWNAIQVISLLDLHEHIYFDRHHEQNDR